MDENDGFLIQEQGIDSFASRFSSAHAPWRRRGIYTERPSVIYISTDCSLTNVHNMSVSFSKCILYYPFLNFLENYNFFHNV